MRRIRLSELAYARSGDKGDKCNVGLMAKDDEAYRVLCALTPELIREHFGSMVKGDVEIYPMPNINAFNIVMNGALGGGATRTLRWDQTGKSMGNALLRLELEVDG